VVALILLPFAAPAGATYEHARAVGKRCATCHDSVHPDATNLNATGRFFLVNRRLPRDGEQAASATPAEGEAGAAIYKRVCATCHGPEGKGTPIAPSLVGTLEHGDSADKLRAVVRDGVPGTAMVSFKSMLTEEQIQRTVEHMLAMRKQ
jgi:mono/diheme cytochrome c family protein